ncbi:Uncharacterised protein [Mycobacterium tuberculosis]|uniref:hypothetical protein n=1 Tax=Mycobacterium tuberculosis TaxID=1773 RepID=UPI0005E602DD|nr:hypothetical protein [Mycobacterium tuberculosis]CKP25529.1 Uncharacterised protein [Mycobacterium tuberculosis]
MRADVTAEHLTQVVRDIAVIDIDDGVAFNLDTSSVQEIRERADYPGLRVRVAMSVGPWQGIAAWDVSTGEPIAPWPTRVTIDRTAASRSHSWATRPRPSSPRRE